MKRVINDAVKNEVSRTEAESSRFAGFVAELRRRGRAAKTIGSYRSDWIGFTDWFFDHEGATFSIESLTAEAVRDYRKHLEAQSMRPATINRKLVFIKRYATWASEIGLARHNNVASVRSVKPVAQGPRRPRGLSDLELKRFLREVENRAGIRDQAIIYALLETGLRVSELVELRMSQLIISGRRCMILIDDLRRSGTRTRRLNLTGNARRKLIQYTIDRGDRPGLVFLGERGPLTANAVQRIVRKYCAFAKVKVSPSTLRHTFATNFLANEGDIVALADLLGHESLETTRLYLAGGNGETAAPIQGQIARPRVIGGVGDDDQA